MRKQIKLLLCTILSWGNSMIQYIVVIMFLINSFPLFADSKPGETKIVTNNLHSAILIYSAVTHLLTLEYIRIEDNLSASDRNYTNLRKYIADLVDEKSSNMDPKLIESKVIHTGSEKYLNEYKGLFIFLFNMQYITSSAPEEITYCIDKDGRITYFEARNMFKYGDKQVYDRSLLRRFIITKETIQKRFNVVF